MEASRIRGCTFGRMVATGRGKGWPLRSVIVFTREARASLRCESDFEVTSDSEWANAAVDDGALADSDC